MKYFVRRYLNLSRKIRNVILLILFVGIFAIRGWGTHRVVRFDDSNWLSFAYAKPWTSALETYGGYLTLLPRIFAEILTIGSVQSLPFRLFVISILIWGLCALAISECLTIKTASSANGLLSGLVFCLLPVNNFWMIGQLGTVAWPILVLLIVVITCRTYPKTLAGRCTLVLIGGLFSLSLPFGFIPLIILVFQVLVNWKNREKIELNLIFIFLITTIFQTYRYLFQNTSAFGTERKIAKLDLAYLIKQLRWAFYSQSPDFLRRPFAIESPNDLILGIVICLFVLAIIRLVVEAKSQNQMKIIKLSVQFFIIGAAQLIISFALGGYFAFHYLVVPSSMFWLGVVILIPHTWRSTSVKFSVAVLAGLFLSSALPAFRLSADDHFYHSRGGIYPATWRTDVKAAKQHCQNDPTISVETIPTPPYKGMQISIPCTVLLND